MNNGLTEKWEKTGLLDQLDDFNKNECAVSLNTAVDLLLGEMKSYVDSVDKIYYEGYFAGTILPIIRRLYDDDIGCPEKMPKISMKWLFEDWGSYAIKNHPLYEDLRKASYIALDAEAEYMCDYTNELALRI